MFVCPDATVAEMSRHVREKFLGLFGELMNSNLSVIAAVQQRHLERKVRTHNCSMKPLFLSLYNKSAIAVWCFQMRVD